MVFRDFPATLRATAPGLVVIAFATGLLLATAPTFSDMIMLRQDPEVAALQSDNLIAAVCAVFVLMGGYIMVVTAWHRYVLRPNVGDGGGYTPPFGILLGYLGRSILIGLIAVLAMIPFFLVIGAAASLTAIPFMLEILSMALFVVIGWLALRISLILPACSVSDEMTLRESWAATEPMSQTILKLAIALGLAEYLLGQAEGLLLGSTGGVANGLAIIVSTLFTLVSASVLTTLYGVLIEGREV